MHLVDEIFPSLMPLSQIAADYSGIPAQIPIKPNSTRQLSLSQLFPVPKLASQFSILMLAIWITANPAMIACRLLRRGQPQL